MRGGPPLKLRRARRILVLAALAGSCHTAPAPETDYPDAAEVAWELADFSEPTTHTLQLADGGRIEYCGRVWHPGADTPRQLARFGPDSQLVWSVNERRGPPVGTGHPASDVFFANRLTRTIEIEWEEAALVADATRVFLVQYSPIASGASVVALDLGTGAIVWTRHVQGFGEVIHSRYDNAVCARLIRGALVVFGHEGAGDYIEVFSPDGTMLSTRIVGIPTRAKRVAERVSATTIHGWNTGRLLLHGGSLLASAARPNPQAAHFWDHGGIFFRRGPDGTWAEVASLPHDAYTMASAGDGSLWAVAPVGYEDVRILRSPPPGDPARLQEVRRAPCSYLGAGVSPEGNFLLLSAESGDSTAGRPNAVAAVFFDHATGVWHESRIPTPEGRYGYEGIVLRGKSAIAVLQASLTDREHPDVKGSQFSWRHVRLARCADLTKGEWNTRGWLLPRDGRTFVHDLVAGPDGRLLLSIAHVAAGSHEELLRIERTPHQVARISEDLSVESFPTGLDVSAARLLVDRRGGIHLVGRQGSGSLRLFDLDPATFRPIREYQLAGTERLADYVIHTLCPERHGGERDGDTIHLLGAPSPQEPPGRERGEVELWHVSFRLGR